MSQPPTDPPPDPAGQQPPPPGYGQGGPYGAAPPPPGYGSMPGYGPGDQQGNQPGYQPGYGPPTGGIGQPANLLPRFLARLIDFILIGIVSGIIGSLIGAVLGLGISSYGYGVGRSLAAASVSSLITAVVYLGYFTLMESRNGQTLGKMLVKLQTRGPDGGTPTTEQAFRRNAWTGLSVLGVLPVVGAIIGSILQLIAEIMIAVTISQSPVRQGWHDRFAGGTQVFKIG